MSDLIGRTLLGRYRVESFIGRGGMADVYKVWDCQRATYLAMKLLREELAEDRVGLRRFKREAQNLSRLQHPNIVRYYGLEQDGALAFILMDFVEGQSLRREIFDSGRPLSNARILQVMEAVCSALHYAHREKNMVHCDMKPANIMINQSGAVLVADFGIARATESTTTTMAEAGTPAYMAPEQVRGEPPTPQTDIYALGVTLYEMVTGGERPFTGDQAHVAGSNSERVRWEQTHLQPPSPRPWNPNITRELEAVILKCLQKEPGKRYAGALDLLNALKRAVSNQHAMGRMTPPSPEPKMMPPSLAPRSRFPVAARVGVAALVLLLLVWIGIRASNGPGVTTPTVVVHTTAIPPVVPRATAMPSTYTPYPASAAVPAPSSTPLPPTLTSTPALADQSPLSASSHQVFIPAGPFTRGSTRADVKAVVSQICSAYSDPWCRESSFEDELTDKRDVYVRAFYIDRYEVTNARYAACVTARVCDPPASAGTNPRHTYFADARYARYPVVYVTWLDASTFCNWIGARLPTADEWEKAARGNDDRWWPWGGSGTPTYEANFRRPGGDAADEKDTSLVGGDLATIGSYPSDTSLYGVMDMAGNVMEWVDSWYDSTKREIRGGSWNTGGFSARVSNRSGSEPREVYFDVGFRCAMTAKP